MTHWSLQFERLWSRITTLTRTPMTSDDKARTRIKPSEKVTKLVAGTEWNSYTKQFDFYFLENGVTGAKTKKPYFKQISTWKLTRSRRIQWPQRSLRMMPLRMLSSWSKCRSNSNLKSQRWLLDNRARNSGKSVSHCCHLEALGHGMQIF